MQPIDSLMTDSGPAIYYDTTFMNVLEDFMTYLRTHPTTNIVDIDQMLAYKYEFDFFGLLAQYGIPPNLHWVTLRMNNMTSPNDFAKKAIVLLVPNASTIEAIRQSHMSTRLIN
jgi:hypothetical protein